MKTLTKCCGFTCVTTVRPTTHAQHGPLRTPGIVTTHGAFQLLWRDCQQHPQAGHYHWYTVWAPICLIYGWCCGKRGIGFVSGKWQVTDISFTTGSADLVALMLGVSAAGGQALLQGNTAFGDRDAVSCDFHCVLSVAVSRLSRTVDVWSPSVALIIVCCLFTGETLKSTRIGSSWRVKVDNVFHCEVSGLSSFQTVGQQAQEQEPGQGRARVHGRPRRHSYRGPGSRDGPMGENSHLK